MNPNAAGAFRTWASSFRSCSSSCFQVCRFGTVCVRRRTKRRSSPAPPAPADLGHDDRGEPSCRPPGRRPAPDERADPAERDTERFDHTAPLTVLINPEIEVLGPEIEGGWEGCLSVPELRGFVERPAQIRYQGVDAEGRTIARKASGFHARVVQHEYDHLDGILYPQRMKDLSKLIFESEARHWLRRSL